MTLGDFFKLLGENPFYILTFFTSIPLIALLTNLMGSGEGNISPWRYLYSTLLYLVCIPGIFSVTLSIYFFLFEKRPILETDIYIQIVPILSMIATIVITKRNADLNNIPGFDKLSGLIMMISATLIFMWFIDRTHIMVFSYMPFQTVLIIFAILLIVIRVGWSRFVAPSQPSPKGKA